MMRYIHRRTRGRDEGAGNRFFDPEWYSTQYSLPPRLDPWEHYISLGEQQNFYPHPYFCPFFYRRQIRHNVGNLLIHYHDFGFQHGLLTHPLQRQVRPDADFTVTSAITFRKELFSDYHQHSETLFELKPLDFQSFINPYFDPDYVLSRYPESSQYVHPLDWYLTVGGFQGASTSPHIDFHELLKTQSHLLFSELTPLEWMMSERLPFYHFQEARPLTSNLLQSLKSHDFQSAREKAAVLSNSSPSDWITFIQVGDVLAPLDKLKDIYLFLNNDRVEFMFDETGNNYLSTEGLPCPETIWKGGDAFLISTKNTQRHQNGIVKFRSDGSIHSIYVDWVRYEEDPGDEISNRLDATESDSLPNSLDNFPKLPLNKSRLLRFDRLKVLKPESGWQRDISPE